MDLLMSRYSDINFIMESDIDFGMGMIVEAYRQRHREEMFILYSNLYPMMSADTFIPFEKFYEDSLKQNNISRSRNFVGKENKEEVMKNVNDIMKDYKIEREVS